MKGIRNILLLLLISLLLSGVAFYDAQPDGITTESREDILNQLDVHEGMTWRIRTEIPLGDKMICSIYSEHKNGIAVFRKQENGTYKWQGCSYIQRPNSYPLWDNLITERESYHLFLLDRDDAAMLEVIYTETGTNNRKVSRFDVSDTDLVYDPFVFNSCQIEYNYYDAEGNPLFE